MSLTVPPAEAALWRVKTNGMNLEFIPPELRTGAVVFAAVSQDMRALQFVPRLPQTLSQMERIVLEAVQRDGRALQWVPPELQTETVVFAAVRRHVEALEWVPPCFRNQEILFAAIETNAVGTLRLITLKGEGRDIVLAAVEKDGNALEFAGEFREDIEIILTAVKQNVKALAHVPLHLRNENLLLAAIETNAVGTLRWIKSEEKSWNVVLAAVKKNGGALKFAGPKLQQDAKIALTAVQNTASAVHLVSSKLRKQPEFVDRCILVNFDVISDLHQRKLSQVVERFEQRQKEKTAVGQAVLTFSGSRLLHPYIVGRLLTMLPPLPGLLPRTPDALLQMCAREFMPSERAPIPGS